MAGQEHRPALSGEATEQVPDPMDPLWVQAIQRLVEHEHAASALRPLDMIPLTDEVETVAVLRRAGIPLPRVIHADREILVVEKEAKEKRAIMRNLQELLREITDRVPRDLER